MEAQDKRAPKSYRQKSGRYLKKNNRKKKTINIEKSQKYQKNLQISNKKSIQPSYDRKKKVSLIFELHFSPVFPFYLGGGCGKNPPPFCGSRLETIVYRYFLGSFYFLHYVPSFWIFLGFLLAYHKQNSAGRGVSSGSGGEGGLAVSWAAAWLQSG